MITQKALCLKRRLSSLFIPVFSLLFLNSCNVDDVGSYYTFTGQTIGQYLLEDPDEIGVAEFYKLAEHTQVLGLLNAYGEYTCFVPTDEAMFELYKNKGVSSLEELIENYREDEVQKLAYDHIIKDVILKDANFNEGIILSKTMSDRFISMSSANLNVDGYYYVNVTSAIINLNLECHNGVVHILSEALQPTEKNLAEAIEDAPRFKLFNSAMKECMLDLLITEYEDENYDEDDYENLLGGNDTANGEAVLPEKRKFGFTVFMQSDSLYEHKYGITDLDGLKDLAASIYNRTFPEDAGVTDVTDRRNSLNRFISYQMLDRQLTKRLLMDVYTDQNRTKSHVPNRSLFEYIETMCTNTLMEISHFSTSKTNLLNYISDDQCVKLLDVDFPAVNGVFHEIDGILAYDYDFRSSLASKRLRLDVSSFFPELTNNGFRGGSTKLLDNKLLNIIFPASYFDRMTYEEYTKVMYLGPNERFCDYQGDEFFLKGTYEFEIITPPIPKGTYEVRFGYQPTNNRGVAQLYWDSKPIGIPLDMTIDATDPKIGWVEDGSETDDPYGYENDKMMRNRGYMKGPASFRNEDKTWYTGANARLCIKVLRRILGRFDFEETTNHKFRVKAVKEGECMLDYLEFVPAEILEYEDIY